jgi:hypothetical protein
LASSKHVKAGYAPSVRPGKISNLIVKSLALADASKATARSIIERAVIVLVEE